MPPPLRVPLNVAVVGCAHGQLKSIYDACLNLEHQCHVHIDLLLCCGDFQACRCPSDLSCLCCPQKYRQMSSFAEYYNGTYTAPILTVYIGGNHEASNLHVELHHGGWVAPNIYYLGYAGVVRLGGWRIAGIGGIDKAHDRDTGHWERIPFKEQSMRSVYHTRQQDAWRLMLLQSGIQEDPIDLFLSHDWPNGIARYGDLHSLLNRKRFLAQEIHNNTLGSQIGAQILKSLQPTYWFSAHLHVKYAAMYPHAAASQTHIQEATLSHNNTTSDNATATPPQQHTAQRTTQFLALDKALPNRDFLQLLALSTPSYDAVVLHNRQPPQGQQQQQRRSLRLQYDLDWLCIVKKTNVWMSTSRDRVRLPLGQERAFVVTEADRSWMRNSLKGQQQQQQQQPSSSAATDVTPQATEDDNSYLDIPLNWTPTVPAWYPGQPIPQRQPAFCPSAQTAAFTQLLMIPDNVAVAHTHTRQASPPASSSALSSPVPTSIQLSSVYAPMAMSPGDDDLESKRRKVSVHPSQSPSSSNPDEIIWNEFETEDKEEQKQKDSTEPAQSNGLHAEAQLGHALNVTDTRTNPDEIDIDDVDDT